MSGQSGFLTPHFTLSQDADFVIVRIRLPHLLATSEGEFYVDGCEFKFYLKPYFLRLTFRRPLVEDGREKAEHDVGTGVLTVWLPKETAGEHFEGLDMLTELLRKPTAKQPKGPLIEVISSSSNADGDGDADDAGDEDDDDIDLDEVLVEQQMPTDPVDGDGMVVTDSAHRYGFNCAHHGVFVGLEAEGLVKLSQPEMTTLEARRRERCCAEDEDFDPDHYMADFMEEGLADEAMAYVPWWRSPEEAGRWRDADTHDEQPQQPPPQPQQQQQPPSPHVVHPPPRDASPFALGGEYQSTLLSLPRKEFLLETSERRRALCGLLDLLFAYAYDVRTTGGEPTVESGWTIRHLSSVLSYLDAFDTVRDVALACTRRSLCYPLIRHLGLSRTVLADVSALLRLGRPAVLRALLDVRGTVQAGGEHGYLLNRIWLDDYLVWLQQLNPKWLTKLAEKLDAETVSVSRETVGWPLAAYEELALEDDDDDDDSDDDDKSDARDGGDNDSEMREATPLEPGGGVLV